MKPLAASLFVASLALGAAAAQGGDTIAVLDLRSHNHPIAAAELSDRVREAVQRALPEARIVDRDGDADLVITGRVSHGGLGYRAFLELRDRQGAVLQRASATAGTRRELVEAIDGATTDLLRSRQEAAAAGPVTIGEKVALPEIPAPAEVPEDALNLDADAGVLVAWDRARRVEVNGKENPDAAADAWRRVASLGGRNPFKEIAATRAQQWETFAQGRRTAQGQMARDTTRLRRVLPAVVGDRRGEDRSARAVRDGVRLRQRLSAGGIAAHGGAARARRIVAGLRSEGGARLRPARPGRGPGEGCEGGARLPRSRLRRGRGGLLRGSRRSLAPGGDARSAAGRRGPAARL